MSANSTTIELDSIYCDNTSELGSDEVYIHYSIDGGKEKRFPSSGSHSMSDGDTWNTDLLLSFKESVLVGLYDSDNLRDDFLGSHTYTVDDSQPETVTVSNTNGAEYQLSTTPA